MQNSPDIASGKDFGVITMKQCAGVFLRDKQREIIAFPEEIKRECTKGQATRSAEDKARRVSVPQDKREKSSNESQPQRCLGSNWNFTITICFTHFPFLYST